MVAIEIVNFHTASQGPNIAIRINRTSLPNEINSHSIIGLLAKGSTNF